MNKFKNFLFYLLVVIFYSCTNTVNRVPKSYTISSIKNKGVIIKKGMTYPRKGVLVIQTKDDIISEEISNIDREPRGSIFNLLQVGDTLK